MTVLIVEDDPGLRQLVRDRLQDQGVQVTATSTLAEAVEAMRAGAFKVVIADLARTEGSGLDVLTRLRRSDSNAHLIVLGSSTAEIDRVRAFQHGADDYVVKPFYVRELTARVMAVRRRRDPKSDACLQVGPLVMDVRARTATADGTLLDLTAKEFDLLAYLAARPGHVFSREELLKAVWHSSGEWQQAATVTEHIRRIRAKIEEDAGLPPLVSTVRGAGYRLEVPKREVEGVTRAAEESPPVESGILIHVDGRTVFADPSALAILGRADTDTLVGTHVAELVAPESMDAVHNRLAARALDQPRRSELMSLERADGGQVSVEIDSSTVDWHGQRAGRVRVTTVPDASSRLRRAVTGVLGELADAVIITDLHFHIQSWNAAAQRLYGWSEREALGRHVLDMLQWVGDQGELAAAWTSMERRTRWNGEGRHTTRDGSVVCVLATMTLLREDSGEPAGVVSVNRLASDARHAAARDRDADAEARIRRGIASNEFEVYYQPIIDLVDRRVTAVEALVRWNDPEVGLLSPAAFLDDAERSGQIVELGYSLLEQACRQGAEWRRTGYDLELAVNLSARQLADPGLAERLEIVLASSGFDPAALWLEITETALVDEVDKAGQVLRRLVGSGVRVAIDDFGTGWASLTYLRSFPVHALKIDQIFVQGVGQDATDTAIVRSILSLGTELALSVVAEGIETEGQRRALQKLGCSLGQGHLYGQPGPAAKVPVHRARRLGPLGRSRAEALIDIHA